MDMGRPSRNAGKVMGGKGCPTSNPVGGAGIAMTPTVNPKMIAE